VSRAEAIREEDRFDAQAVAENLEAQGVNARPFETNALLYEALVIDTLPFRGSQRVVVFFSNGSFDGIIGRYASTVKA